MKNILFIAMLAGIGNSQLYDLGGVGDLNGDGQFNVLDIVILANCVLAQNCNALEYGWEGDINEDGAWNVLDIVALANCVLANNCGG